MLPTIWKYLSFFPASPLKKDLEYSRAPSLQQGYAVLAISTTTDSSATLLSFCPFRLLTYKAYICSLRLRKGQGGFSPVDSSSFHPCRRCYPATALLLFSPYQYIGSAFP